MFAVQRPFQSPRRAARRSPRHPQPATPPRARPPRAPTIPGTDAARARAAGRHGSGRPLLLARPRMRENLHKCAKRLDVDRMLAAAAVGAALLARAAIHFSRFAAALAARAGVVVRAAAAASAKDAADGTPAAHEPAADDAASDDFHIVDEEDYIVLVRE